MPQEKEKFADLIRQLIPISELPPQMQNEAINKAELLEIKKKKFVFKQGDQDEFSYYCLEGEIEMLANDQQHNVITGGSDKARYAMSQLQPRQFSAKARTNVVVMRINRDSLDRMIVLQEKEQSDLDEFGGYVDVEEVDFDDMGGEVDWTTRILQSELFSKMPTANIHALFAMLEPVDYNAGDIVITQGEPGEDYFIIQEGSCQVTRKPPAGDKEIKLAVLNPGDSFGEEALITETTRNATISMITDGTLMRLSKDSFVDLIKKPTLSSLSYDDANKLVNEGTAEWLDVRFNNEHESSAIAGSQNIPLNMLRIQADKLDPEKQYILYCDTEGRSSTGAFLLTGLGFDVYYLEGGLVKNPQAAPDSEKTQPPRGGKQQPADKETSKAGEEVLKKSEQPAIGEQESVEVVNEEEALEEDIDPEIRSTMLETELEITNTQLNAMKKQKAESDDEYARKMQEEVEKRLQEERAKIEAAKKAAEEEARKLREQEEAKIKKMQEEVKKRMEEEKKKLEDIYNRNAEEMDKLERLKKEASDKLNAEKAKLQQQAAGAKSEIEDAKKRLEQEALRQKQEQEVLQKQIEESARQKLAEERRKLAEQLASNQEELERARREKDAAEAARKAAKEEAEKIIAETLAKHDQDHAAAEEKLKEERLKLEQEQKKIQETLKEINRAKDEATAARRAALEEAKQLKARRENKEVTQSKVVEDKLNTEIKQAEAKASKASRELAQAQQAQVKVIAAKKLNQDGLIKQKAMEDELQKQLDDDLSEFREELEEQERETTQVRSQMEYMKRIKEKAQAAKKKAESANASLLDEISAQLGKN